MDPRWICLHLPGSLILNPVTWLLLGWTPPSCQIHVLCPAFILLNYYAPHDTMDHSPYWKPFFLWFQSHLSYLSGHWNSVSPTGKRSCCSSSTYLLRWAHPLPLLQLPYRHWWLPALSWIPNSYVHLPIGLLNVLKTCQIQHVLTEFSKT